MPAYAQPTTFPAMDLYYPIDQKQGQHEQHDDHPCTHAHAHRSSPSAYARAALIALALLFAAVCVLGYTYFGPESAALLGEGLLKRATGDPNSDGPLVNRKLYLIIVFVGLFVVIVLAVMLSAWCCKGAFQNPLCCPCYLCACCGGLACLECIGCGLCAEGLSEA